MNKRDELDWKEVAQDRQTTINEKSSELLQRRLINEKLQSRVTELESCLELLEGDRDYQIKTLKELQSERDRLKSENDVLRKTSDLLTEEIKRLKSVIALEPA